MLFLNRSRWIMPGNYNCYECKKTELEKAKSEFDQCLEKIREERKPVRIREDRPIQIQKNKYITRIYKSLETSVYKGYKQDKIEMRGDRAEMSDFPLYLNTVAGGLDRDREYPKVCVNLQTDVR